MATEDLTFRFNVTGNAVPELQKVQRQVRAVDNQIRRGNASLKAHSSQYNSTAVAANKFAKGALQQAGFQVGDFVVQVTNGTSAMQAFGQQGAQLAGVFGPIGAVVGAGIAIFAALAIVFEKSKLAAENAAGGVLDYQDALDKASSATTEAGEAIRLAAATNVEEARKKFADFDGDLKGYLDTMKRLRTEQAMTAAAMAANSFFEEQSVLSKLRTEYQSFIREQQSYKAAVRDAQSDREEIIQQYEKEIGALEALAAAQDIFSAADTRNQIKELQAELDAVRRNSIEPFMSSLSLPQETIQNMLILENAIKNAFAGDNIQGAVVNLGKMRRIIEALPAPLQEKMMPALLEMEGLARQLGAEMSNVGDQSDEAVRSAMPLVEILSNAAINAGILARNIAASPAGFQRMRDQTAVIQAEIGAINAGYGELESSVAAFRKQKELELGLADAANAAEDAYISALINREVDAFRQRQQATNQLVELKKQFTEVGSSGGAAMSKIKEKTQELSLAIQPIQEKMKGIANTIERSMEGAFMSVVDGTKTVGEAFRSMAVEIIKELYRVFVVKQITGFITNAIGGYFNLNQVSGPAMPLGTGSVRPVARPSSFAGGGYTGNGARAGGLDGKGGFMAMMHPRESVIDHTRGQSSGGVVVNQTINVSTGVQQTVRSEIRSLMPQIAESAKGAVLDAKRRGGSYGRAFA
jgi:hypothetical protein